VPSGAISVHLKRAVLVAEDIGFFRHHGFAPQNMREAMTEALEERKLPRGASTITQQLAKNLWLSPSRSPLRKAREAVLTWQLERTLSKAADPRVLPQCRRIRARRVRCRGGQPPLRSGKPAAELNEDEAARLAAGLPRPRAWHRGEQPGLPPVRGEHPGTARTAPSCRPGCCSDRGAAETVGERVDTILQLVLNGLAVGCIYGLVALGSSSSTRRPSS